MEHNSFKFTEYLKENSATILCLHNFFLVLGRVYVIIALCHISSMLEKNVSNQALSRDFQRACGKMHAQILLSVRWFAMSIFLFLKLYNFNKGIVRMYSIFKNPKTSVFKCHLLTF